MSKYRWPPNKAWTSLSSMKGFRHFVLINYGGKGIERWVILVSVLDGKSRMRLKWTEMRDKKKWASGWKQLPDDEGKQLERNNQSNLTDFDSNNPSICLHASSDWDTRNWF